MSERPVFRGVLVHVLSNGQSRPKTLLIYPTFELRSNKVEDFNS